MVRVLVSSKGIFFNVILLQGLLVCYGSLPTTSLPSSLASTSSPITTDTINSETSVPYSTDTIQSGTYTTTDFSTSIVESSSTASGKEEESTILPTTVVLTSVTEQSTNDFSTQTTKEDSSSTELISATSESSQTTSDSSQSSSESSIQTSSESSTQINSESPIQASSDSSVQTSSSIQISSESSPTDNITPTMLLMSQGERSTAIVDVTKDKAMVEGDTEETVTIPIIPTIQNGATASDILIKNEVTTVVDNDISNPITEASVVSNPRKKKKFHSLEKYARRGVISVEMTLTSMTSEWTDKEEQSFSKFVSKCLVDYLANWTNPTYMSPDSDELASESNVHYVDGTPYTSGTKRTISFYISSPKQLGGFDVFPSLMVIKSLEICDGFQERFHVNVTEIHEGPRGEPAPTPISPVYTSTTKSPEGGIRGFFAKFDPLVVTLVSITVVSVVVVFMGVFCWTKCKRQKVSQSEDGYNIEQEILKDVHMTSATFEGHDLMPAHLILQQESKSAPQTKTTPTTVGDYWVVPISHMTGDKKIIPIDTKL